MSDTAKEAWRKYLIQLQAHPLRTKAITAGVLAGCSDLIAQKLSGIKKIQFRRMLLIVLYGLLYSGPFGHFFHKFMDILFKRKKGSTTVAKKVLLEQLTSSPWNNMFFMMYYGLVVEAEERKITMSSNRAYKDKSILIIFALIAGTEFILLLLFGRPWGLVKNKFRKDYPSVQLTAWKFWPIVGWVNYQYMPLQFRVLFHSFVASSWGIFLNLKARSTSSVAIKKA